MTRISNKCQTFATDGVEIRPSVLSTEEIESIKTEVSVDHEIMRRTGIRNLEKKFESIARIAAAPSVLSIAESLLARPPQLVRALFFDKTPERNWFVTWHQDRTVTLNRRFEMAGWGPWMLKDGVHHVQPPRDVGNRSPGRSDAQGRILNLHTGDETWSPRSTGLVNVK